MNRVYLDNAATTRTDEVVVQAMLPYFTEVFGNSHSQHEFGREAHRAVDVARKQVADAINAHPNEVYFTGSGSEADNWAIKGTALGHSEQGKHIITTQIEHHAILNSCAWLEKHGFEVTYLPVDEFGTVRVEALKKALRPDTTLVSVMMANNEVGTIQPVKEIAKIVHENSKALFHVDAVQAMGSIPVDVKELDCDLLSISAHKFYGPKGIGALYIRNGVRIDKLIVGGGQERSMRGGTTNTPAVVGMGVAIENAVKNQPQYAAHCAALRDHLVARIRAEIPDVKYNGSEINRLPNNANFSFEYIEGESLLMRLDLAGIAVSSGSACSSGSLEPSHVLHAMGVDVVLGHGSIRFSFGKHNTLEEVDYVVDTLRDTVALLRKMSPLYSMKKGENKNA